MCIRDRCIAEWCHFCDIHISQGSVATCLRRGGIFKHEFVANLLLSPLVKKVWKSDNSWWNYGQEFCVLFFLTHGVVLVNTRPFNGPLSWTNSEWWGAGVVVCLERGADCMWPRWCHCHWLSLASVKSRLVLPFWYRLTRASLSCCKQYSSMAELMDHTYDSRRAVAVYCSLSVITR